MLAEQREEHARGTQTTHIDRRHTMRMLKLPLVGLAAFALCLATSARAAVETGNKGTLTLKGFVSATVFAQDSIWAFGDGQNAEFPSPTRDKGDDPWFLDGDVRNTRFNLTYAGPDTEGLPKVGAALEVDFFGGSFSGGFQNAQPVPRLRLAYADLAIGKSTLRIGQAWSPWFGNFPLSLSHIAFPLGYGSAGNGGWRFPGVFLITPLTAKDAAMNATLTVALMRNTWPSVATTAFAPNQGSASIVPQIEARLDLSGKAGSSGWSAYAVGHYDRKDLSGRGEAPAGTDDSLDGYGGEVGAKLTLGQFMVQGNAYWAQAMAQQFANLTQFGDIAGFGGWAQVGYDFTKNWGVFAFYGFDDPDDGDVVAALPPRAADPATGVAARTPLLKNQQAAAMLRYKAGPYQLGLEYLWDLLDFEDTLGESDLKANQIALSVNYAF